MTTSNYHYLKNFYPATFKRRCIQGLSYNLRSRNELSIDKFFNITQRIIKDQKTIEKTCGKYRGSLDPWLPVKPFDDIRGMYIDEDKKRGFCLNSKVNSFYHRIFLIDTYSSKITNQLIFFLFLIHSLDHRH